PAKTKLTQRKPELKTGPKKKSGRTPSEKTGLKKTAKSHVVKTRKKKPDKKSPAKSKTAGNTDTAQILNIIMRSRKGVDVAILKQKTGFDEKKIRNLIYKAHKEGIIRRAGRGICLGTKNRR
ncbi:MAG: hypothetical protein WBB70_09730, partial [Desulfobacterales bacterium]